MRGWKLPTGMVARRAAPAGAPPYGAGHRSSRRQQTSAGRGKRVVVFARQAYSHSASVAADRHVLSFARAVNF